MTSTAMNDLREAMLAMTDIANEGTPVPRQVTHGATLAIMNRSLGRTGGLPMALRQHLAFRDLSDFISLSQKNKSNLPRPLNTDLLPVCNPMSTRTHAMTAAALRRERTRWIVSDPRMQDGEARALVAAMLMSDPASARFAYYSTRVAALPQGLVPLEALVASFGDGNSSAARSARAKMQRRDRKGRFAWMGGGLSAFVRRLDGSIHRLSGRMVAQGVGNDNTFDMELPNGSLVRVPAGSAEGSKAFLASPDAPDGYSPVPAQITSPEGVIDEKDLVYLDAPNGFYQSDLYQGTGTQYTDDAYTVTKLDPNDEDTPDLTDGTKLNFDKPVYVLENSDGSNGDYPIAVTQSWATTQDAIRFDELQQDKKAGRESDPIALLSDDDYNDLMDTTGDQDPYEVLKTKPYGQAAPAAEKAVPDLEAPLAKEPGDFSDWIVDPGMYLLDTELPYVPEGYTGYGEPGEYTDDPAELAKMFHHDDLVYALEMAVIPPGYGEDTPASGAGLLTFEGDGGETDEMVPAEAIFEALAQQGGDPEMELAKIYDANLIDPGQGTNVAKLKAERAETENPTPAPSETPKIKPEALAGLTPEEAADAIESGDYVPYLMENTDFYDTAPEGYFVPDTPAYEPLEPAQLADVQKQIPGFFDNPMELASHISQKDLVAALRESVEPSSAQGQGHVEYVDESGDSVSLALDGEAIRDALQLQGVDTNKILAKIYDEGLAGQENLSDEEAQAILEELYPDGVTPSQSIPKDIAPAQTPGTNPDSFYSVHPDGTLDPSMEYTEEYLDYLFDTSTNDLTTGELSDLENVIKQVAPANEFLVHDKKAAVAKEIKARSDLGSLAGEADSLFEGQQYVGIPAPDDMTPVPDAPTPAPTPTAEQPALPGMPEINEEDLPTALQLDVPQVVTLHAMDLEPNDVTVEDHFTITSVYSDGDSEAAKPGSVWVEGYYPGHTVQKTKLWYADTIIQAYRGMTPPQQGDLPPLSKPKPKEYDPNGKIYKHPVNGWVPSDKQAQLEFADAQAAYDAALEEATASWSPEAAMFEVPFTTTPDLEPAFSPGNHIGTVNVPGALLQPGDVTFKKEKGKDYYEFFIVEGIDAAGSPPGKVNVIGHYPGHETQTKTWNDTTSITAMRGVDNPPAPGPLPALERPSKSDPDYAAKKAEFDAKKKASAETFVIPVDESVLDAASVPSNVGSGGFKKGPQAPTYPAFSGQKLAAIFAAAKGHPISIKNLLAKEVLTYIDFESTGGFGNPKPIQVAVIKKKGGTEVERLVMYINPGEPLDDHNLPGGKGNVKDSDGNPISDEFLSQQTPLDEAMAQILEFIGPDAIVVAQNMAFDGAILKRRAAELGLDYSPAGEIDTLALARTTTSISKNDLKSIAGYYELLGDGDNFHDAVFDTDILSTILGRMLDDLGDPMTHEQLPIDLEAEYKKYLDKHQTYLAKLSADKQDAANLVMAKVWDDGMADGPAPDLDQMIEAATVQVHIDPDNTDDGTGVETNPTVTESILGGFIDDNWVADPANTTDIGKIPVEDWKPGDFIDAKLGGFHEIIAIDPDPNDEKRVIVSKRLLANGKRYDTSWVKYGKYTVYRRNELVNAPVPEPVITEPAPVLESTLVTNPDGIDYLITIEPGEPSGYLVFLKGAEGQAALAHVSTTDKAWGVVDSWAKGIESGSHDPDKTIADAAAADVEEGSAPEKWKGYDLVQDKRGVWHAVNLSGSDAGKLKAGIINPPHLPFFAPLGGGTGLTTGEGHFYSVDGQRHWGQFGAAGVLVRRKDANGDYEYLLALRSTSISTGGGTWSTPGGAHKNAAEAAIPGATAKGEFQEELGIDITTMDPIAISVADVSPDWKYETVIFEVSPQGMNGLTLGDGENTAFDWFTADQLHYLQAEGKLHPSFSDSLDGLLALSDDHAGPDASTPDPDPIDPVAADLGHVFDITGWKKIAGSQAGSNPGFRAYDPDTGQEYYVKIPKSDKHAANEVLASAFYAEMGIPFGHVYLGKDANGNTVLVSPILDGNITSFFDALHDGDQSAIESAQAGFVTDAWLNNWDSVGLVYDNMVVIDGVVYRLDPGAALLFRAQGADKAHTLTPDASTVDSLRDPKVNPQAADVFDSMTDAQLKESAQAVADITPEKIDELVDAAFPDDKQTADFLKERLKARREDIMQRFGVTPTPTQNPLEPQSDDPANAQPGDVWSDPLGYTLTKMPTGNWLSSTGAIHGDSTVQKFLAENSEWKKVSGSDSAPETPEVWKSGTGDNFTLTKQPDGTWISSSGSVYEDEIVQETIKNNPAGWTKVSAGDTQTPLGSLEAKPTFTPSDPSKAQMSPNGDWFWAASIGDWLYSPQGQAKANSGEIITPSTTPGDVVWVHNLPDGGMQTFKQLPDGWWEQLDTGELFKKNDIQDSINEFPEEWEQISGTPAASKHVVDPDDPEEGDQYQDATGNILEITGVEYGNASYDENGNWEGEEDTIYVVFHNADGSENNYALAPGELAAYIEMEGYQPITDAQTSASVSPAVDAQINDAINAPGTVTFQDDSKDVADSLVETAADGGLETMDLDEILAQQEKFKNIVDADDIIADILQRPGSTLNADGTITLWSWSGDGYEYKVLVRKNPDNTFSTMTVQTDLSTGASESVEPYTPKHSYTATNNHIEAVLSKVNVALANNLDMNTFFKGEVKKSKKKKKNGKSIQHLEDTHISADGVTKVLPGMVITNVKTGQTGKVIKHLKTYSVVRKATGTVYTYTDYTYVKYDGQTKQQKVVTTSLQITDGSGNPIAPAPTPTPTPEPPLAEWEKELLGQDVTPTPAPTAPAPTAPATTWDGTVKTVSTPQELQALGFPKNSVSHLQEFGVYDYDDYKQLLKGKLVKDYNNAYNMVPGIVVNDRLSGTSQSHGIVLKTDSNAGTVSVKWLTGPKAGQAPETLQGSAVTSDERFVPYNVALEYNAGFDTTLQDEAKAKATQMMKDKAEAAKIKAEAEAKKQAADAAKAAIQAQVNAAMVKGPGVSVVGTPTVSADWTESHSPGVPSLVDALHKVGQTPQASSEGASVLIDSDSIEDLNVRITKVRDKNGVVRTRLIFKITSWKGEKLTPKIKSAPGAQSSDRLEVKKYKMGTSGYLEEVGLQGDDTDSGNKGTTITVPILDANGNTIGTYQIHRAKKTGEPDFAQSHGSNKPNVSWHNQMDVLLPEDASPEMIEAALQQIGIDNVRPAGKQDMLTVAENKIISIFGNKSVGTENLSGPARIELLDHIKAQWGIDAADVTYEVAPGSNRGDIMILLPEEIGKKLATATGKSYFNHYLTGSPTSGMTRASKIKFYADLLGGRANGLYSGIVRRMEGLPTGGMSPSSDQTTTGAHYIFTSISDTMHNGAVSGGSTNFTFYADQLLRRLDWYANYQDGTEGFGKKHAEKDSMGILMSGGSVYETLFRTGIPWSALAGFSLEGDLYADVIAELKSRGITMIGNTPIEEFEKKDKK